MIRRPPRSTLSSSSAASDVYKRQLFSLGKTISIDIFIKIQWANFDELILFNCWLLNMFFPFSSVSNQTYLLRKNRYQLTVFDRLNSYYFFLIITHISSISILGISKSFIKFSFTLSQLSAARSNHLRTVGGVIPNTSAIASLLIPFMAIFKAKSMTYSSLRRS